MKILIKIISIVLLLAVMVFFLFAPDILVIITDKRAYTINKQEIPEVTLSMVTKLTPEKKFLLANSEKNAIIQTDKNTHTDEEIIEFMDKIFVDFFEYIYDEDVKPDVLYEQIEPKLYMQSEYISSIFWVVAANVDNELYFTFVFDDEDLELLRYEVYRENEADYGIDNIGGIVTYFAQFFNSGMEMNINGRFPKRPYDDMCFIDLYFPNLNEVLNIYCSYNSIYMNRFMDYIEVETDDTNPSEKIETNNK